MARLFRADTGDEAYLDLLQVVGDHGDEVSPRGQPTRELLDVTIEIGEPTLVPPFAVRSNLNLGIAAVETVQLLAGVSDLPQLDEVSKGRFSRYANGGRLRGAYGPRLVHQLPEVERRLRADPDTRQAIAVLWCREEPVTADVPCTLSLTFRIRHNQLGLKVHMRSNDVMLGVPYDWFVFSRVQLAMADCLGLVPGPYVHHVDSLHLYDRDRDRAVSMYRSARLVGAPRLGAVPTPLFNATTVDHASTNTWKDWVDVRLAARELLFSDTRTPSWWTERLPLVGDRRPCRYCNYVVPLMELRNGNGVHTGTCHECRDATATAIR